MGLLLEFLQQRQRPPVFAVGSDGFLRHRHGVVFVPTVVVMEGEVVVVRSRIGRSLNGSLERFGGLFVAPRLCERHAEHREAVGVPRVCVDGLAGIVNGAVEVAVFESLYSLGHEFFGGNFGHGVDLLLVRRVEKSEFRYTTPNSRSKGADKRNPPHHAVYPEVHSMQKNLWSLLLVGTVLLGVGACKSESAEGDRVGGTKGPATAEWVPFKRYEWFDAQIAPPAQRPVSTGPGNVTEGDTIKIGMIASLSGPEKPWGEESVNGARLLIDEINEAGGINGKKIELIVEDTAGEPATGKSATEKLIGERKVVAILGEVASGVTAPSAQVAQERGVPIISIGSTRIDLSNIGNMFFRVCYTDEFQGAMMAKFAYEDLGLRNVAILTDKKLPYSVGLSNNFRDYFTRLGGKIATEAFYEKDQTDFKGQLTNIKAANPDGLFCSGYFTEIGPIARQKKDVGLDVPMFGGDGWDSSELLQAGGEGIIGTYYSNHYSNLEDRQEVKDFVSKFERKYKRVPANAMAALGYDAALVLVDSLKRAKSLDSKGIRDAIAEAKDVPGVSGSITIGPDGNARKPGIVLTAIKK